MIFNRSLKTGDIPDDWRKGNIASVYKKGDRHKPSNYRPVSLTSICSRKIEHILFSKIRKYIDRNNIFVDEQHGFRLKRSYESQLLTFTQYLVDKISPGGQADAVVLDFSKAFDKVPHRRLVA